MKWRKITSSSRLKKGDFVMFESELLGGSSYGILIKKERREKEEIACVYVFKSSIWPNDEPKVYKWIVVGGSRNVRFYVGG